MIEDTSNGGAVSRRRILQAITGASALGLAGCDHLAGENTSMPPTNGSTSESTESGPVRVVVDQLTPASRTVPQATPFTVTATLTNEGEADASFPLSLDVDGDPQTSIKRVPVRVGSDRTVTFDLELGRPGRRRLSLSSPAIVGGDSFSTSVTVERTPAQFVTRSGRHFTVDGAPLYVSGANVPLLTNPSAASHRLVDEVFADAGQLGLDAIRTFAFCRGNRGTYCFQPSPGEYRESAFRYLDYIIYRAKQHDVRLVLAVTDYFSREFGMGQYVSWSETANTHTDFYTDAATRRRFKQYIEYVLTRRNIYTGVQYRDDPTILLWELANEPRANPGPDGEISDGDFAAIQEWIEEMSAFVKSVDSNHMVSTGSQGFYRTGNMDEGVDGTGVDFIENHRPDTVDACSFHFYPRHYDERDGHCDRTEGDGSCQRYIQRRVADAHEILEKPVYAGEFNLAVDKSRSDADERLAVKRAAYRDWYDTYDTTDADGAFFWTLDGHDWPTGRLRYQHGVETPEDRGLGEIVGKFSQRMAEKSNGN